jgi:hypothetical protein
VAATACEDVAAAREDVAAALEAVAASSSPESSDEPSHE